jgi:hypothetical protein
MLSVCGKLVAKIDKSKVIWSIFLQQGMIIPIPDSSEIVRNTQLR